MCPHFLSSHDKWASAEVKPGHFWLSSIIMEGSFYKLEDEAFPSFLANSMDSTSGRTTLGNVTFGSGPGLPVAASTVAKIRPASDNRWELVAALDRCDMDMFLFIDVALCTWHLILLYMSLIWSSHGLTTQVLSKTTKLTIMSLYWSHMVKFTSAFDPCPQGVAVCRQVVAPCRANTIVLLKDTPTAKRDLNRGHTASQTDAQPVALQ